MIIVIFKKIGDLLGSRKYLYKSIIYKYYKVDIKYVFNYKLKRKDIRNVFYCGYKDSATSKFSLNFLWSISSIK